MKSDDKYPPPPRDYRNPEDDPKFISGLFPTTAELADQLARQGNDRLPGVRKVLRKQESVTEKKPR